MTEDTAIIERDLAAVDAALASGAASGAARELQELALVLQAEAPQPEAAFAEQLRGRVEAGFPRAAGSAGARAAAAHERQQAALKRLAAPGGLERFARRFVLPVVGVGVPLALIVGLIFALGGPSGPGGGDDDGASGGGGGAVEAVAPAQ